MGNSLNFYELVERSLPHWRSSSSPVQLRALIFQNLLFEDILSKMLNWDSLG